LRYKVVAIAFSLLLASGCATEQRFGAPDWKTPYDTIQLAAAEAPHGVPGKFIVQIQAVGSQDGFTYLNTELDYRDQRNLSIALSSKATNELEEVLGATLEKVLIGKRLLVTGEAKRVRIVFTSNGKITGKYYYQTHVNVSDANQIQVLSGF